MQNASQQSKGGEPKAVVSRDKPVASTTPAPSKSKATEAAGVAARPVVNTRALSPAAASRLEPQVAQFQGRYQEAHIVHQPTESGWTWLFLAWALSNHSKNSQLEADSRAMRSRMTELEQELRADPQQWDQLQELANFDIDPPSGAQATSAGETPTDDSERPGPAANATSDDDASPTPASSLEAIAASSDERLRAILLCTGILVGAGAVSFVVSRVGRA